MSYMSPCGYVAPSYYDSIGTNWLKSFTAGFLTTCGLEAVGSPCVDAGETLPLHGTIGNLPCEQAYWTEEEDALVVHTVTKDETSPSVPGGTTNTKEEDKILSMGDYQVVFVKESHGYAVNIVRADSKKVLFRQEKMAEIKIRGKGSYTASYSSVKKQDDGYLAEATVTTDNGSVFSVKDAWYVVNNSSYGMKRTVTVTKASSQDVGFASVVTLLNGEGATSYDKFDFFIPSILYKDSEAVVSGAIASNLDWKQIYVKETRTGLPMVMARSKESGYSLALTHLEPEISVGGVVGGGGRGAVNNKLQYGGIGITSQTQVGISFVYPCTETPISYDSGFGSSERYHSVKVNNSHTYKVGLIPAQNSSYADAMVESYKSAYLAENRYIADIDMGEIYKQNMQLFKSEYTEYSFLGKITAAGMPWQLSLPDASEKVHSFQMGFVGEQIPVGYQMYRYGLMNNDNETKKKGINIVNTWTSKDIQGTYFPAVWWDPANTFSGGQVREYPSFLRCMIDGMEGMLDAYRIAEDYGEEKKHAEWYNMVYKFANNLVKVQNADGSFYRAYNRDSSVCTDNSSAAYQGTSTLNTPIAIRFLARMYEYTGEVKYKNAALAAAEYSYNKLYLGLEKYVGGTPDNPNTVDKEAAVYALYGFLSAYQLSGDKKYMKAAEHAAVSTMSWTYVYGFAVPNRYSGDAALNPFANGGDKL